MKAAIASTLLAAGIASAAPIESRATAASGINDYAILQYALTLEHLEATFYAQGLANFSESDFTNAGFSSSTRAQIAEIGGQEKTHVGFLSSALTSLGQTPTAACNYAFGVTDPKSFLATASILEGVGVSAYLGAAASIMDKTYLTAAGAILTVESRHSSFIRSSIGEDPTPAPFDIPLDFDQVYSLASLFITSCPKSNPTLPVKAFPALAASGSSGSYKPGSQVKLTPAKDVTKGKNGLYAVWIGYPTNAVGAYSTSSMMVEVPKYGFCGQNYVVLSTSMNATDDTIIAGPAVVEIDCGNN